MDLENGDSGTPSSNNEHSLKEAYSQVKRKEKRYYLKLHQQNQDIDGLKNHVEELKNKITKLKNPVVQDICFDRCVNNELNALIDIRNDLEIKIDEVKMNILKKKIEISDNLEEDKEFMETFEKNTELGKKIGKSYFEGLQSEIQQYKKIVEDLRDQKKKILAEIADLDNEQKNENEVISSCRRMLREQENKVVVLQKEIDEVKDEIKVK